MSNANNLKYSNPSMDPKYTNLYISDSSSEVGQVYGNEVMQEEIADDQNALATNSQASDITNTFNTNNHNLLYQPSLHMHNKTYKIIGSTVASSIWMAFSPQMTKTYELTDFH